MASPSVSTSANPDVPSGTIDLAQDAWNYWIDAWQRGLLFLDVPKQRSARYEEVPRSTSKARLAEIEALFESVERKGPSRIEDREKTDPDTIRPVRAHTARRSKHH